MTQRCPYKTFGRRFNSVAFSKVVTASYLTPQQIAAKLGSRTERVTGWMNGLGSPRPNQLERILALLGCKLDDIAPRLEREPAPVSHHAQHISSRR